MKQVLQQYAAYNIWANKMMVDCINNLSEEQLDQEIVSSFSSLRKTIIHMWDAESAWWQRMKLEETIVIPSVEFGSNFQEMIKQVNGQSLLWKEWVDNATEARLEHVFAYQNSKREQFKQPVYEVLLHLFNHGTYHRGQLVTMLRQLGVEKIPQTDFIVFCRKKG